MQNPYFAAKPSSARNANGIRDGLSATGMNTGNLLFISALRRVVQHQTKSDIGRFVPEEVRERHDGVIVPAANWLSASSDFGGLASLIEKADLPTTIVGLGAQSFNGQPPILSEGTLRLVKVIAERSKNLSVRGPFTAEVLAHYGINNVVVTGCPSLLWHVDRPASATKLPKKRLFVSLNGTRSDTDAKLFKNPVFKIGLLYTSDAADE